MKNILVITSFLITVGSIIPYIRDILAKKTKPNIVSWLTWTLLTSIATAAALADQQYITAMLTLSAAIETGIVVVLGIKYGHFKYTRFDIVCQVGALIGFALWIIFNSPKIAVVATLLIDLVGSLPTVRHAWIKPGEETTVTYAMAGFAGILTLIALDEYTIVSLSYPIYIVLINTLVALVLILRANNKNGFKAWN